MRKREPNVVACPTCGKMGHIITFNPGGTGGDYLCAQWHCDMDHKWFSLSEWRDDLARYVLILTRKSAEQSNVWEQINA